MFDTPLRTVRVPVSAWQAACDRALTAADPAQPCPDDWAAAAWKEATGDLLPESCTLLRHHLTAPLRFHTVALHRDLAYVADVSVNGDATTSRLLRHRIAGDALEPDPDVEFAVIGGSDPWPLLRRVLPPQEQFRAAPCATPAERVSQVPLDKMDAARVDRLMATLGPDADLVALPRLMQTIAKFRPEAVVLLSVVAESEATTDAPADGKAWVLASDGCFLRACEVDGQPRLERVEPGDLGHHVSRHALVSEPATP